MWDKPSQFQTITNMFLMVATFILGISNYNWTILFFISAVGLIIAHVNKVPQLKNAIETNTLLHALLISYVMTFFIFGVIFFVGRALSFVFT